MNPFLVEQPALISFSGGRTSALMLRRVIDAFGGSLPKEVVVTFANTGKEKPETLDFVRDVGARWHVAIRWLEYQAKRFNGKWRHSFREVSYATASRRGQPFAQLVAIRRYLPNPMHRICTQELKIRVMKNFARSLGWQHWTNVVGMRADEPHRVAKLAAANDKGKELWVNDWPLARAGITKEMVSEFWQGQDFDLQLQPWQGNCDLCFLKGLDKQARILRADPSLADFWIKQEKLRGTTFRKDGLTVEQIRDRAMNQPLLPLFDDSESLDCACTD